MIIFMDRKRAKDCEACDGTGKVEVCAVGHGSANCPCPTRRRHCQDCDGSGEVPMTDDEIEALEDAAAEQ